MTPTTTLLDTVEAINSKIPIREDLEIVHLARTHVTTAREVVTTL
jgi:hypothetical protein